MGERVRGIAPEQEERAAARAARREGDRPQDRFGNRALLGILRARVSAEQATRTADPVEHDAGAPAEDRSGVAPGGSPLPSALRGRFERSLGVDLGTVRTHGDGAAASAAQTLGANAFTVGKDIYFGASRFDPASRSGQLLLAHEVAHAAQPAGGPSVSAPDDAAEREASHVAPSLAAGMPVRLSAPRAAVARQDHHHHDRPLRLQPPRPPAPGTYQLVLRDFMLPPGALYAPHASARDLTVPALQLPQPPQRRHPPYLDFDPELPHGEPPHSEPTAQLQFGLGGSLPIPPTPTSIASSLYLTLSFPRFYAAFDFDVSGNRHLHLLGEPALQFGVGLDLTGDPHLLGSLMFNLFRVHVADALGPGFDLDYGFAAGVGGDLPLSGPAAEHPALSLGGGPFITQAVPEGRDSALSLGLAAAINANYDSSLGQWGAQIVLTVTVGEQVPLVPGPSPTDE